MTETAAETDVKWVIALAGREEQIVVEAATIEDHSALNAASTVYHVAGGGSGDVALTVLRNAAGEIVFRAPTLSIAYLRRYGPPEHIIQPGPRNRAP